LSFHGNPSRSRGLDRFAEGHAPRRVTDFLEHAPHHFRVVAVISGNAGANYVLVRHDEKLQRMASELFGTAQDGGPVGFAVVVKRGLPIQIFDNVRYRLASS
jgi:hypothetical protein